MSIQDVVIHTNIGVFKAQSLLQSDPPPHERFDLAEDLWIGRLDHGVAGTVMDLCEPNGQGVRKPVRQFAQLYAFVRELSETADIYSWDHDQRLQTCVALSRLVHPTSVSLRYAARIRYDSHKSVPQIFPSDISGVGVDTYLAETADHDWLVQSDLEKLKKLVAVPRTGLPFRVSRALWHHEYAVRTYYVEVQWVLVCTALEALVHTDRNDSTGQFVSRVSQLAKELRVTEFGEPEAEKAYDLRCSLSHGQGLATFADSERQLYQFMERVLRRTLLRAMENPSWAQNFATDCSIRNRWPLS